MNPKTLDAITQLQGVCIGLEIDLLRFQQVRRECEQILYPQISQCAWCKRIRQPDGSYTAAVPEHNNITHGICPECAEACKQEAKQLNRKAA